MTLSVCMATCNGEAYVREQIDSILSEIGPDDEVVVVDDCSTDDTVTVVRSIRDSRIKLVVNAVNVGHVQSFDNAMALASNEVILLADQDDVWQRGRAKLLTGRLLAAGKLLASSNFALMDRSGRSVGDPRALLRVTDSDRHVANIAGIFLGKRPYFGCAMALRRELLAVALPIPGFVESHDLWLAMAANVLRSTLHIDEPSLTKRLHGGNVSPQTRRGLPLVIKSRLIFARSLAVLATRVARRRGRGLLAKPSAFESRSERGGAA